MDDLKQIKNKYGENMMHLCRELFPTILESDGKLFKIISNNFAFSKYLYDDIINNDLKYEFKNYIYNLSDLEITKSDVTKSPKELLNEAGYNLYECTNYDEVEQFRKYYKKSEELCTFKDIDKRLNTNYVFFAIKKDVDNIKREDFIKPERQDKYGTSVISIQFTKGNVNTLSIKNRYNHTVVNPDATFSNNLDNIIEGLTESFNKEYDLNINSNISSFEIPGYVRANDKKYYKYSYEINNIYYCPNNIIIDNFEVKRYDKERYIVLDYFILDMKEKTIYLYDETIDDSFTDEFNNIEKIEIKKEKEEKIIVIDDSKIEISLDKFNIINNYKNEKIYKIGDNFCYLNKKLTRINLPNVERIGDNFLYYNKELQKIELPNVEIIGTSFLHNNDKLQKVELPKVKEIGNDFLYCNEILQELYLPNVKEIGCNFLHNNDKLQKVELLNVKEIGNGFLFNHDKLQKIELPNVERIGDNFLYSNKSLQELYLPQVKEIGTGFLSNNESLQELYLPNLDPRYYSNICNYLSDNFNQEKGKILVKK